MKKELVIYPKINIEKVDISENGEKKFQYNYSTCVRVLRDSLWYSLFVEKSFIVKADGFVDLSPFVISFNEKCYQAQVFGLADLGPRTIDGEYVVKPSDEQISEFDRLSNDYYSQFVKFSHEF